MNKRNKYFIFSVPNNAKTMKSFCSPGRKLAAWYTPYDNIKDLSAIRQIDIETQDNCVKLVAQGYSGARDGRVRIRIYADVDYEGYAESKSR